MRKTTAVRQIKRAYDTLPDVTVGWRDLRAAIFEAAQAGERSHRRGHPAVRGFSVATAARYFTVKWLREFTLKPHRAGIVDILHMRDDASLAAATAAKFRPALRAWVRTLPADFDSIDYAELMQ